MGNSYDIIKLKCSNYIVDLGFQTSSDALPSKINLFKGPPLKGRNCMLRKHCLLFFSLSECRPSVRGRDQDNGPSSCSSRPPCRNPQQLQPSLRRGHPDGLRAIRERSQRPIKHLRRSSGYIFWVMAQRLPTWVVIFEGPWVKPGFLQQFYDWLETYQAMLWFS